MRLVFKRGTDGPFEMTGIVRHEVGQRAELRVAPPRLYRVELQCVGGQPFDFDVPEPGRDDLSSRRAMHTPAIPTDDQRPPKMAAKLLHEVEHLVGADVLVVNLEG